MKIKVGEPVRVYRNLHKNCWSVMTKTEKGWRVKDHYTSILIAEPVFKVRESGRQKVLREKKKNVHAFIEGTFFDFKGRGPLDKLGEVTYNPYKHKGFVWTNCMRHDMPFQRDGDSCHNDPAIRLVHLCPTGVFVKSMWDVLMEISKFNKGK